MAVPVEAGHWNDGFCWLPDGRFIYPRRESNGSADNNLWQRGIDSHSGKPVSEPKRITHWAESETIALSASANGDRLAVIKWTRQGQIEVGQLAAGGTRMNVPRPLTTDESNGAPSGWTPDSKAVLLTYNHNGRVNIFKQPIAPQAAEPLTTGPLNAYLPRVSPDGAWILYLAYSRTPPYTPERLMRVPVNGGVPQFVLQTKNWIDFQCGRAPASCIVIERTEDRKWRTITAFDPLKGRGKLLRTIQEDAGSAEALSPDGLTYAVARNSGDDTRIQLLSLSNGPDRQILVKGWTNIWGMDYASDGKGLYCGSVSPQGRTLLYVDLKGTAQAQVLRQYKGRGPGIIIGVPSPDGRYIAILGGTLSSNVWMLGGF